MIPDWAWAATATILAALFLFDYFFHVRSAHTPTLKEAATWSAIFIGIAMLFGLFVTLAFGHQRGMEYFAGYLTEEALSIDNLFVFLIILSGFRVPRAYQQKVLMVGILLSIFARALFILAGAALLERFTWLFYLLGALLLMMAGRQLRPDDDEGSVDDNPVVRLARRFFRAAPGYDRDHLFTRVDGHRVMTPMLLVMLVIGMTDILFALDSIPAIFGLTDSAFIIFSATAFSLMGLRQLFFLIDGLLDRLVYLKPGLAVILAFIGIKLILEALAGNNLPFINGGEPVTTIEIGTGTSLAVIATVLVITVAVSLTSSKGKALTAIHNARRHAREYLDLDFEADAALREAGYQRLKQEEAMLHGLDPAYRHLVHEERELQDLVARAHQAHRDYLARLHRRLGHAGEDSGAMPDRSAARPGPVGTAS